MPPGLKSLCETVTPQSDLRGSQWEGVEPVQRLAHLLIIQSVPTLVVDDPRRSNRSPRSQRMPRIQKELGNAQVVWYLRAFTMHGAELMDYGHRSRYARHFTVRLLVLEV